MGVLHLVCCGAPPAADIGRIVPLVERQGWDVWVIATPLALPFLDAEAIERVAGRPLRSMFRLPSEARSPEPDAVLAAPLTFSSLNKWAAGIADTYALATFTESLGAELPVVAVPWAKPALTAHPAYARSIDLLRSMRATVIDDRETESLLPDLAVPEFPWRAALAALPTTAR
jgi:phosphopantothenoylcysteine synthetase/decarboxylase